MEQVFDTHSLSPGDKIVSISDGRVEILEFLCIHPHNDKYSLFLNRLNDGTPKFIMSVLKRRIGIYLKILRLCGTILKILGDVGC